MKCPKCGKEIANDSLFCEHCGVKITFVLDDKVPMNHKYLWAFAIVVFCLNVFGGILYYYNIHKETVSLQIEAIDAKQRVTEEKVDVENLSGKVYPTHDEYEKTVEKTQSKEAAKSILFKVGDYYKISGKQGVVYNVTGDKLHGKFFRIEWTEYTWDESCRMAKEAGGRLASYKDLQLIGKNFGILDDAVKKHLTHSLSQLGAVWVSDERNKSIFFCEVDKIEGEELPGYPGGVNEFELLYPVFVFDF